VSTAADVLTTPGWSCDAGDFVATLAWSPDGSRLLVGTLAGAARVLDGRTGQVATELPTHELGTLSAAWHPDGSVLATGGQDGILRLHRDGSTTLAEHQLHAWVHALAWQPTGDLLAAGAGRVLHLCDPVGTIRLSSEPLASTITDVAWAVNKRRVAAACYGGVSWFELEHGRRPAKHFAWKGSVLRLAPSPDGRWLPVGAQDNTVHIWRLWSADELEMNGYPTKVEHLAWHHASRWMAVGNLGEITIWDFGGRGPGGRRPQQIDAHERSISALAFQPDGDLMASGSRDGTFAIWDTSGKRATEVARRSPDGEEIAALAWSPSGDDLVVATAAGAVLSYPTR
jgi:WD40 repeat protein